ncbi:FAD-dependent oxidoreductase [Paracoccus denitrificans]|jgi:2-polyprenyl-6-methoxyphenol hydroxylase-like FAD-dependent oxidoreductase|uniref:Monooxygenase, FAD-binding protein n=1 Tax=Paracoccus denitrificans (strain Pd 1222) TaxID=318586 RepID=A1B259_PARDP|nr:FAD-dependent oxidoreductase [Paracoccus denitrificans]ABL69603.1 monooxygenase, FAD-binding protein [Paracoccus denitrificans PD1222]MBB4626852.1 2-polyprenyl-6-methoxyphenol hydroxylase-like FAD-dependent oxidoreductase [Paracoccus denitrificans]MCU7427665.1 FAD-dependent oxidoreductase [Paracoccus denitrificans]QAR24929.1 FAD-dependent oxidoreductase [Paracoccus denitrificans]UPV93896.1 FAD-dependent oxidoreductase [Paracoccus denitrificans]
MEASQSCVIAGGGPAGMMAGLLLARAGLRVTVLEKHPDFLRDFRGDTIHPATLELMAELDWLEEFLALPHQKAPDLHAEMGGRHVTIADFSHLPLSCRYIAFMPQWDFLNFLAGKGEELPNFQLLMGHRIVELLREGDRICGVHWENDAGDEGDIHVPLVIGADGRQSVVREQAGLEVVDFGSAVDVIWFRLSRSPDDPAPAMSHAGPQQGLVLIDRGDFWQCGYVIRKGGFDDLKALGLTAFRAALAALAPLPSKRFEEIADWDQVYLLSIRMDRLKRWWAPGVLCIGDAAHAMSPVGGFGVNLAIQDAVATANILSGPLRDGVLSETDLARVQARRMFPTRATQRLQRMMRRKRNDKGEAAPRPPGFLRMIARFPILSRLMGRLIGMGFRPEHISKDLLHDQS